MAHTITPHRMGKNFDVKHAYLREYCSLTLAVVEHLTLRDIKPSFKDDTNIVPISPCKPAFSNGEKAVESDVKVYRKDAESI